MWRMIFLIFTCINDNDLYFLALRQQCNFHFHFHRENNFYFKKMSLMYLKYSFLSFVHCVALFSKLFLSNWQSSSLISMLSVDSGFRLSHLLSQLLSHRLSPKSCLVCETENFKLFVNWLIIILSID